MIHELTKAYADYHIIVKDADNPIVKFYLQGTNNSVLVKYVSIDKDGNKVVQEPGYTRSLGESHGQNVQCTKNGGVDIYPIPLQDVTSSLGIDSKGVTKTFIYNGVVTGTMDEITWFVMVIEMIINGKQLETTTTLTYDLGRVAANNAIDPVESPIPIMFQNFTWSLQYGQTVSLNYTLQFAQANPIDAPTSSLSSSTIAGLLISPLALFATKPSSIDEIKTYLSS